MQNKILVILYIIIIIKKATMQIFVTAVRKLVVILVALTLRIIPSMNFD